MPEHTFGTGRKVSWSGGVGPWAVGHDGVLMIQGDETPSSVQLTGKTPAWDRVTGYHGSIKNPRGFWERSDMAFDRRQSTTGARDDFPIFLRAGDSVLLATSKPQNEMITDYNSTAWSTPPTLFPGSRSVIAHMDAVVVVPYDPTDAANTLMSPPVIGNSTLARNLRLSKPFGGEGLLQTELDMDRLPSVVDLSAIATTLGINVTVFDTLKTHMEAVFGSFLGDVYANWTTDTGTPGEQHPGYGGLLGAYMSQALVLLASTRWNASQKTALARGIAQYGLHLAGGFLDDRYSIANGGHCQGRTAAICLFGYLANQPQFLYFDDLIRAANNNESRFQEQLQHEPITWWTGNTSGTPWSAGWKYNSTFNSPANNGQLLANNPSTWPANWRAVFEGYYGATNAANIGTALFFKLIDEERAWGVDAIRSVEQWMDPTLTAPAAGNNQVHDDLVTADINFESGVGLAWPWRTEYHEGQLVAGLCAKAWDAHNLTNTTDAPPGKAPGERDY